jgi:triacylglycerol esterase/lipase EstA (alpha/beta hydrolase family)
MGKQLVYFVHGLDGDHRVTWGRFPELIRKDPDLKDTFDIGFFSYPTSLFSMPWSKKYPKVQTLADALRTEIDMRFKDYTSIILVCHSLGGLIARKYLLEEVKSKRPLRVQGVMLSRITEQVSPKSGSRFRDGTIKYASSARMPI